jgi:catechol 2,3-dioxygenase-like lactoylglutathione lyase family enzyme
MISSVDVPTEAVMLPFERLSHVSVVVSDLEKARAFYGGVLGLNEIPRPAFDFPGAWYSLGGDVQLHVIVNASWPFRPRDGFEIRAPHFALWVGDADALAERMERRGCAFDDYVSTPTGLRQLFVHDPDGNMVEFLGPTRRATTPR